MLPERDPLLMGASKNISLYLPEALIEELDRQSRFDGVKSRGQYAALLLIGALRIRERERAEEAAKRR